MLPFNASYKNAPYLYIKILNPQICLHTENIQISHTQKTNVNVHIKHWKNIHALTITLKYNYMQHIST